MQAKKSRSIYQKYENNIRSQTHIVLRYSCKQKKKSKNAKKEKEKKKGKR